MISQHSGLFCNADPMISQRNDRYPPGGSMGGRPEVESPKQQQQQQQPQQQQQQQQQPPLGPQGGPAPGFGRGGPIGGVFDGPNNKRRRY